MEDNYTTDFYNVITPEQLTSQSFIADDSAKVVNLQLKAHDGVFEAMGKFGLPYDTPFAYLWRITWEKEDEIYLSFWVYPHAKESIDSAMPSTGKTEQVEIYLGRRDLIFSDGDFQITFIANRKEVSVAINDGITLSSLLSVSTSKHLASRQQMIEALVAKKYRCEIESSVWKPTDNFTEEITVRSFLFSPNRILFFPYVRSLELRFGFKFRVRDFSVFKLQFLLTFGTSDLCEAIKKGDAALNDFLTSDIMINGKSCNKNDAFDRLHALFRFFFDLPGKTKYTLDSNIIDLIDIAQNGATRHHASHWNPPIGITHNLLEVLTQKEISSIIEKEYNEPGCIRSSKTEQGDERCLETSPVEALTKAVQAIIGKLLRSGNYCDFDEVTRQVLLKWQGLFKEASSLYREFCDEISSKLGKELIDNVSTEELLGMSWEELSNLYEKKYLSFRDALIPIVFHFPYLREELVKMLSMHNELAKRILLAFTRKLLSEGNNQNAALGVKITNELQERVSVIQVHLEKQKQELEKENLSYLESALDIYNRNVETDIDLLKTIHEIINTISAKERAEAAAEEAEKNIRYISHDLQHQIPATVYMVDMVLEDSQLSLESEKRVRMVRRDLLFLQERMSKESISFRPVPEALLDDINDAKKSSDAKYLGTIIMGAIRKAMPNVCSPKFDLNAFQNYFGPNEESTRETAQSIGEEILRLNIRQNKILLGIIDKHFFDFKLSITEDADNLLIGNDRKSVEILGTFLLELFLNAVKYVSELPRDKRVVELTADLKDGCLLFEISNTYNTEKFQNSSANGGGGQILNRLVNGLGAMVVEKLNKENVFTRSYKIPVK